MEASLIIALSLALLVGISLGLLGGGGSILTVPILSYVLGMEPREAIAASLFIVGVTSAVSVASHARAGRVRWRMGVLFGAASMVGAFTGGIVGGYIPGAILMVFFAGMMIATAAAMVSNRRPRGGVSDQRRSGLPVLRIVLDGTLVGLATGLVGAGGGFLIVPALNLFGGLPMAIAVGTSLLVIVMKSGAGLAGYLVSTQLNWPIITVFTGVTVAGSFIGVRLAGLVPEEMLRRAFGYFVLVTGAVVLIQEVPKLIPV